MDFLVVPVLWRASHDEAFWGISFGAIAVEVDFTIYQGSDDLVPVPGGSRADEDCRSFSLKHDSSRPFMMMGGGRAIGCGGAVGLVGVCCFFWC